MGFGEGQIFKNVPQISVGLQSVGFGRLDKREKGGTGLGALRTARKKPVLSAHHKGADGVFNQGVVRP